MSKGKSGKKKPSEYKGAVGIDRVKNRRDLVDQDYLDKLKPEEKAWLDKFNSEYIGATFKKNSDGTYSEDNLHKTAEQRQDCYHRNNARNRCELTRAESRGQVVPETVAWDVVENERVSNPSNTEDAVISVLDYKLENED